MKKEMITNEEIRRYIPRLKMGRHHLFTSKLNDYITQQEKKDKLLELYRKWVFERHFSYEELRILIDEINLLEKEL
jgi:hypothetical protein